MDARFPSEPLNWAQICERFPEQWVYLAEMTDFDPYECAFTTARVIGAGKNGEELDRPASVRRSYDMIAHYFTGAPFCPGDAIISDPRRP